MITLIEGGFFAGGHDKIVDRIKKLTEEKKRSILIVPEQQTVSAESEMTEVLPPYAPLYFEATNFTRFTDTVFRKLGGLSGTAADKRSRALVMWRTLTELMPVLETASQASQVTEGNVTKMLGAVEDMHAKAITAPELSKTADELEKKGDEADKRLISKLRDLSEIMALYKKLLTEHFSDSADTLLLAEKKLSTAGRDFLSDTEIFIDGFTSFTEPQYRIISELIARTEVTVCLTLPKSCPTAFEFSEVRDVHSRLSRLAAERNTDAKRIRLDGRVTGAPAIITEIASELWRNNTKIDTDAYSDIDAFHVYEAESPYGECDFVAQDIKRRVIAGAKYSEFGIIARSIDSYSGILNVSFEKAGVPLFTSKRSDIGTFEVIKLIFSAFSAISAGYDRRDVISYAKCSLSGVDRKLADELELYCEKWQISGRRFTDGVIWNMNPGGFTARREKTDEKLLMLDEARGAVIGPLTALEESLKSAETVSDHAKALVDFLVSLDIENALKKKSRETEILLGADAARDVARLWQTVCDALDALVKMLGGVKVNKETFLGLLKIIFRETDIGRIPSFAEEVTAGSADTSRMYGKKYIYIIGANAGVFPPAIEDDAYFTDKDKNTLNDAGLTVSADTDIRSARELYLFSRAISYARVGVNIVYAAANEAFKATPASEAIKRIEELTDGRIKPVSVKKMKPSDKIYSAEYAIDHIWRNSGDREALREAICSSGLESKLSISEKPIKNATMKLSKESLSMLYGKTVPMSQTKLETFVKCPMSYFCKYDLLLKPEERAEFDNRNIGTFLHSILENFFRELKERGKHISEITADEKTDLITRVADEYVRNTFEDIPDGSPRLTDSINKLRRAAMPIIDSLCDEFSGCRYEPIFFELEIKKGDEELPSPIIFNTDGGKEIYLTGKIDRVDAFKSDEDVYIRVIDYKSGKKIFSPSDIEKGLNLQMFLYLKAVVETENDAFRKKVGVGQGGRMIPAGVIYVKTSIDDVTIGKNSEKEAHSAIMGNQARLGMLLNDEKSIGAMNSTYIPIKFKASDGSIDARYLKKVYTENDWDRINETISSVISELTTRMTEGDVSASPMRKSNGKSESCKYCEFKAICRNACV